ncbi:restriction endonuclease [Kitasatospora sp. NPDC001574]
MRHDGTFDPLLKAIARAVLAIAVARVVRQWLSTFTGVQHARPVGSRDVRTFNGTARPEHHADAPVMIGLNDFTRDARAFAARHDLVLDLDLVLVLDLDLDLDLVNRQILHDWAQGYDVSTMRTVNGRLLLPRWRMSSTLLTETRPPCSSPSGTSMEAWIGMSAVALFSTSRPAPKTHRTVQMPSRP